MKDIKTIFFDLDDTLYSGSVPWTKSLENMKVELQNLYPESDFTDLHDATTQARNKVRTYNDKTYALAVRAINFRDILRHYNLKFNWNTVLDLEALYWNYFLENIEIIEGLDELIKELSAKYKLYILTDFKMSIQLRKLKRLGLSNYFDDVITTEEVGELKRTGKMFDFALETYHLNPAEVLMVGDKYAADVKPAKERGIKTALIPNEFFNPTEEEIDEADFQLDNVLDLRDLLL